MSCLFCKIVLGEIPSNKLYEDDKMLAFHDINAVAPMHFLVIPKEHIESAGQINSENSKIIAHIFEKIAQIAVAQGLEDGYRIVTNIGEIGGQTVPHLHFHVLGKRKMIWPPG